MTKAFSVASWNVERFRGDPQRVTRVVNFLNDQNPDVFAIYEVSGKTVFKDMVQLMQSYQFHITEGPQVQEILVGVKNGFTAFFTQRVGFRSGVSLLRPGALLTLHIDGADYSILFLHTKSGNDPRDFGLRDDMFSRSFKLKRVLDDAAGGEGQANFMFLGDLNSMGMYYPYNSSIGYTTELRRIDGKASRNNMRRLSKDKPHTFWNGSASPTQPSDLDHVVASNQLQFKQWSGRDINIRGWPELSTTAEKDAWIGRYSDHALLFLEVQKV